ncbi:hypothetical protein SCHPADRAFT_855385 [Schizopora paradoxa]|uniref:Pali-domain-containing protein n=1 Tax=Schizopora paradoxa TaxID=27342 RepID=A0A0H2RPP9_9AGAM|nr:hypothetical protein SCHPADRAFT_855385 [Schizopora paradoxa]
MFRHHFFSFLLTAAAFVLLILITFSVPFISNFYFLRSSVNGGVDFGVWGFCTTSTDVCSKKSIGYSFEPQLIFWLTQALVLYPVAAGLTLLTLISLIPVLCLRGRHHHHHHHHHQSYYPTPLFSMLALLSYLASFFAFIFMIALFSTGMKRFKDDGFTASFGPLPWMSIGATVALAIVALSSGCGMMCQGRFSRVSERLRYSV